jgi:hypothetical protein
MKYSELTALWECPDNLLLHDSKADPPQDLDNSLLQRDPACGVTSSSNSSPLYQQLSQPRQAGLFV